MCEINPEINVRPKQVMRVLGAMTGVLVLAHTGVKIMGLRGHQQLYGLSTLFDLGKEGNLPTYFSALLLLLAGVLLAVIARYKKMTRDIYRVHWAGLSIGVLLISVDEASHIHELLNRPAREILGGSASDALGYPWLLFGIPLVFVVTVSYWKFVWHFPRRYRPFLLLAATLYVGGAVGFEFISGRYWGTGLYLVFDALEEVLEICGILVFVYVLLKYMEDNLAELKICIGDAGQKMRSSMGGAA